MAAQASHLQITEGSGHNLCALLTARYPTMAGGSIAHLAGYLAAHAAGNPFFIGELLHGLESDGRITREAAGWRTDDLTQTTVPPVLQEIIARRVARLGEDAERLLGIAAAIGYEAQLTIWARVAQTSEEEILALVERAVRIETVQETADGLGVRFAHPLIREVLYTRLLRARRRTLHRAIAETLIESSPDQLEAIAAHLQHAGDPRAIDWLIRAGDRANRAYASQTAITRFTDALALIGDDPARATMRCELHIRLAALLRITETARAIHYEEEALRLATQQQDMPLQAVARFRLGYLLSYVGERERGLTLQLAGLAALDALPAAAIARIAPLDRICADVTSRHGSVAQRLVHVGRLREATDHAERALAAGGGVLNGPSEDAWMTLAIVDRDMGRPEAGWERSRALHAIFRARGQHDIATWLIGSPLIWAALVYATDNPDRLDAMRALVDAHTPQPGELFATLPVQTLHLPLHYVAGEWAGARRIIAAVRRGPHARHAYCHGAWLVQALIATAQGEPDEAWAIIREEFPSGAATEPGNTRYDVGIFLQRIAATLATDAGNLSEAEAWLTAHDRWLAWSGATLGHAEGELLWARFARARGDLATADERARRAHAGASAPHQPLTLLATHRLRAELATAHGRYAEAERHLDAALALADACRAPYERARTLLARAELRAATGDTAAAHALLDDVRAIAGPMGALPTLARADALAATISPDKARVPQSLPGDLTPREAEVLRALAAGASNREIAVLLGINGRTVERHIGNLYAKIGANSRTDAVAFAFRHGLR